MQEIIYSSFFSSVFKAVLLAQVSTPSILKNKSEKTTSLFGQQKIIDIDQHTSQAIYQDYKNKFSEIDWLNASDFPLFKKQVNLVFRHKNSSKFRLIENVLEEGLINGLTFVLNKASRNTHRFYSYAKSVTTDIHANKGFCRLKPTADYLIGEINPEHDTGDLVLNFFIRRFPQKKIALLDHQKKIAFVYDLQSRFITKTDIFEKNFNQISKEDIFSKYWEIYYESQYIPEKKNVKLALKNFPQKRWRNMFEVKFLQDNLE